MKTHSGFTLVELVIVITIAAILTVMAAPSFRSMIQNNRATTQANELLGSLNLARSEAIRRGVSVSLCARAGNACSGAASWVTGWLMFVDPNGDGVLDNDPNGNGACDPGEDCLLRMHDPLDGNPTLNQTAGGTSVRFLASGQAAAITSFDLRLPDCTGNQARTISTDRSGRSAVTTAAC